MIYNAIYHIIQKGIPQKSKTERNYNKLIKVISELNKETVESINEKILKYNKNPKYYIFYYSYIKYEIDKDIFYVAFIDIFNLFISTPQASGELKISLGPKSTFNGIISPSPSKTTMFLSPKNRDSERRKSLDILYDITL